MPRGSHVRPDARRHAVGSKAAIADRSSAGGQAAPGCATLGVMAGHMLSPALGTEPPARAHSSTIMRAERPSASEGTRFVLSSVGGGREQAARRPNGLRF